MKVPDQLKRDNGLFFVRAKTGSPPDRIAGVENLVESLINTMTLVECNKYNAELDKCTHWITRAHKDYYEDHDVVTAMLHCNAVIKTIGFLCYDERFSRLQSDSFKYTAEVK